MSWKMLFSAEENGCCRRWVFGLLVLAALVVAPVQGQLSSQDVLLVVNNDSPTSLYIADLYRQYYPDIQDNQVVYLDNIADTCSATSTSADEIINRGDFESKIADPIRQHLIDNNMVNATQAIVTTAGLPHRISDTNNGTVVRPGASSVYSYNTITNINAASVESELSVLFQVDSSNSNSAGANNRIVNPYQGYCSNIDDFDRDVVGGLQANQWNQAFLDTSTGPLMEGQQYGLGMTDREFSAGDIYLTARLDGPKEQGASPIYAVHDMLERSRRASSTDYGVNPQLATVVLDDAPHAKVGNVNSGRIYNLDQGMNLAVYDPENCPPDTCWVENRDDFNHGYTMMTGQVSQQDTLNMAGMTDGHLVTVVHDTRNNQRTSQADLPEGSLVVGMTGYGVNGDEGRNKCYLTEEGPDGGDLFDLGYGAVFSSLESFNAVTLFSDVNTSQAKIVDFLEMGGTAAIGHAFEPYGDASIDTEFLFYNLLADRDGDGFADMTLAEAVFSALPYLSWSEVLLGDPLMRMAYGEGGRAVTDRLVGDLDLDGIVTQEDIDWAATLVGTAFGDGNYNDLADVNRDGSITYYDLWLATENLGAIQLWQAPENHALPEPAGVFFLSLGLSVIASKKKR